MAIVKIVNSKASLGKAINYITREDKTGYNLVSGINCSPESAIEQMKLTKAVHGKTGGRQYKHYVQSFSPDENITLEQAHNITKELFEELSKGKFKGYEVIMATHFDRDHLHSHIIVNSVSFETGKKIHDNKKDLQEIRDLSDKICKAHNLSICEPNNEITASKKEKYKALERGTASSYDSYLLNCYRAVTGATETAYSRSDFIKKMNNAGWETVWSDKRKYITFKDKSGHKVRNSNLSKTFKEKFSKEVLINGFKANAGRRKGEELAERTKADFRQRELQRIYSEIEQREQNLNKGKQESDSRNRNAERAGREAHNESVRKKRSFDISL